MLYIVGNVRPLSENLEHVIEQFDEQLPLASFAHPRLHGAPEPFAQGFDSTFAIGCQPQPPHVPLLKNSAFDLMTDLGKCLPRHRNNQRFFNYYNLLWDLTTQCLGLDPGAGHDEKGVWRPLISGSEAPSYERPSSARRTATSWPARFPCNALMSSGV